MQIVCHNIEKEKNVDKSYLIDIKVFKSTAKNVIKW